MHVIVLASRKGGAGKTTLARHLAVEAEGEGPNTRVALMDCDSMGGLSKWWNARSKGWKGPGPTKPEFILTDVKSIPARVETMRRAGYHHLFIDTPGAVDDAVRAVVRIASLVVVPVKPTADDLRAIGETIELIKREQRPMVFAINQATKRARLTGDAAVALSQHGTIAPAIVHQSVAVPESAIDGKVVRETKGADSPSAQEVADLWAYLSARLREGERAARRANKKAG